MDSAWTRSATPSRRKRHLHQRDSRIRPHDWQGQFFHLRRDRRRRTSVCSSTSAEHAQSKKRRALSAIHRRPGFPALFRPRGSHQGFFKLRKNVRQRYESFRHYYRDFGEAGKYFVTFVDNHDQMTRPSAASPTECRTGARPCWPSVTC